MLDVHMGRAHTSNGNAGLVGQVSLQSHNSNFAIGTCIRDAAAARLAMHIPHRLLPTPAH